MHSQPPKQWSTYQSREPIWLFHVLKVTVSKGVDFGKHSWLAVQYQENLQFTKRCARTGGPQPVVVPELALLEADVLPVNFGGVAELDGDGARAGVVKREPLAHADTRKTVSAGL